MEWARVETADGVFDAGEIEHYRKMLSACRERGIVPMVTLFHFTLPQWVAKMGGFESPAVVARFARFCGRMAQELGPQVELWCTENEPTVYVGAAYIVGLFPPGKKDPKAAAQVYANLILAHGQAYHAMKDAYRKLGLAAPQIGIANHLRVFDPLNQYNPVDLVMARAADQIFNKIFFHACASGKAVINFWGQGYATVDAPYLKGTMDFIGVNYYSRDTVRFNPNAPGYMDLTVPHGLPVSEMGWEIYPEGLYRTLMWVKSYRKPIYITENGISDNKGNMRRPFLRDHLVWLARAMQAGADVRGYFHWSLMDNFEWVEGFWPRFGLYRVIYATQERTLTDGGQYFSEVAGSNRIELPKLQNTER